MVQVYVAVRSYHDCCLLWLIVICDPCTIPALVIPACRDAMMLFVLVRDVPRFDKLFKDEVLEVVEQLGFVGPLKEPQRIIQEDCVPFNPSASASKVSNYL